MTPSDLLASLRSVGLTIRTLPDGRLGVAPADLLDDEARGLIREHRDALLALVASEEEQARWDEWTDALCERAWLDPPGFGAGHVLMRESVILRLEGFPVVAVSKEEAAAIPEARVSKPKRKRVQEKTTGGLFNV